MNLRFVLLGLVLAAAASPALGADQVSDGIFTDVVLPWRSLLQVSDSGDAQSGPKTLVITNMNTNGQPVYCVNVTQAFQNTTYKASGRQSPSGGSVESLARLICSDQQAAGEQIFELVKAGGDQAAQAAQAIKQAGCSDVNQVPKAVTVASIQAQDTLGSLPDVESFFRAFVQALGSVGVPACVTLVESDQSGQRVAAEKYFQTS